METISNEEQTLAELGDELCQKKVICEKEINRIEDEIVKAQILYSDEFIKSNIKHQIEKKKKI